jgi:hypothetical protein
VDPLVLRFFERYTAVLIGGMAIYLGYRLFLSVPKQKDGDGKVTLPWNISVVMSRVGPGVFFALFGVIDVGISLIRPLVINSPDLKGPTVYMGDTPRTDDRAARAASRIMLHKEFAILNTIPRELRTDLREDERDSVKRGIAHAKLEMMRPVWGLADEGYGDIAKFEGWINAQEPVPPPAGMDGALELYRYGATEP